MARPANAIERQLRRNRVADLLLGHTRQSEMANILDVSRQTISSDVRAIRREWRAARIEAYERYLDEDIAVLGALQRALWPAAMEGKWLAVDRILAIVAQRTRLLGTEAPIRVEEHVITEDAIDAEISRLQRLLDDDRGHPRKASAD